MFFPVFCSFVVVAIVVKFFWMIRSYDLEKKTWHVFERTFACH